MLKVNRSTAFRAAIAGPVLLLALAGCGGSSGTATSATSAATPTAAPGAGGPGGVDFAAIQACLTAAGISVPTPSGMPSGQPRPSGSFNGTPPADGVPPSGGPGAGGGADMFQSEEAQAALKACGITMPTGRGARPSVTATPTS